MGGPQFAVSIEKSGRRAGWLARSLLETLKSLLSPSSEVSRKVDPPNGSQSRRLSHAVLQFPSLEKMQPAWLA